MHKLCNILRTYPGCLCLGVLVADCGCHAICSLLLAVLLQNGNSLAAGSQLERKIKDKLFAAGLVLHMFLRMQLSRI